MTYQNPVFYSATDKAHEPMANTDQINPLLIPVSAALGNQIQNLADGLYMGSRSGTIYYVNAAGTDAPTSGSLTTPFKTLDYALAQAALLSPQGLFTAQVTIALQAGQTFPMVNDFNVYAGGSIQIAFYGDPNYGAFNSAPVGSGASPSNMSDLARPIIAPGTSTLSPWKMAGFNRYGGNIVLTGIQVNLPAAPAAPNISLYGNSIDFVRNMAYSGAGFVELVGSVINMADITAYWGFMGVDARSSGANFVQYASQFQVNGIILNAAAAPTAPQLLARQYFIKFFADAPGNGQSIPLQTSSSNSTTASGTLLANWADTEALVVSTGKTNQASFPLAFDITYGLRNYIFNLTHDQQQRPLNFISSRLI